MTHSFGLCCYKCHIWCFPPLFCFVHFKELDLKPQCNLSFAFNNHKWWHHVPTSKFWSLKNKQTISMHPLLNPPKVTDPLPLNAIQRPNKRMSFTAYPCGRIVWQGQLLGIWGRWDMEGREREGFGFCTVSFRLRRCGWCLMPSNKWIDWMKTLCTHIFLLNLHNSFSPRKGQGWEGKVSYEKQSNTPGW